MPGRRDQFRDYVRRRLQETGVTMRQLSLAMTDNRDQSYIGQLLTPPSGKLRNLPTPDQLRPAARMLRVPLRELLEVTWGISREDLDAEFQALAEKNDTDAAVWNHLSESQREEVRGFIAYVRARDELQRTNGGERGGHERSV
jgi:hypothetical protein